MIAQILLFLLHFDVVDFDTALLVGCRLKSYLCRIGSCRHTGREVHWHVHHSTTLEKKALFFTDLSLLFSYGQQRTFACLAEFTPIGIDARTNAISTRNSDVDAQELLRQAKVGLKEREGGEGQTREEEGERL